MLVISNLDRPFMPFISAMAKDPANPLCLPVPQTQYQQSPEQQSPQAEEQVDQKRWYKRLAGYAVTEAAAGYAVTRPEAPV